MWPNVKKRIINLTNFYNNVLTDGEGHKTFENNYMCNIFSCMLHFMNCPSHYNFHKYNTCTVTFAKKYLHSRY